MTMKTTTDLTVAIYARVSTLEQRDQQTITPQIDMARGYVLSQSCASLDYFDDGITGMLDLWDRPAGKRLWEDAKAGKFSKVVVYKLDRLGRGDDARLNLNAVFGLEELGVAVVSLTEFIDTSTPAGKLFLTILAGVAAHDRQTFLERTKIGKARVARNGQWWGGPPPYGYKLVKDDGKTWLVIDEESAKVVRDIFRRTRQGETLMKQAQRLNATGVPTGFQLRGTKGAERRIGVWHNSGVRQILRNDIYTGRHAYRDNIEEMVDVPALITREEYEEAQEAIVRNRTESKRNTKHEYLLRGLLKCGRCGRVITGKMVARPGKASYYYRCNNTSRRDAEALICRLPYLPAQKLEQRVWDICLRFLLDPETVLRAAAVPREKPTSDADELPALTRRLAEIETARARVIDLYSRERITAEETDRQLDKLANEKSTIEIRRRDIDRQAAPTETVDLSALAALLRARVQDDPPFEIKRDIVQLLLTRITINVEGKEIVINGQAKWGPFTG